MKPSICFGAIVKNESKIIKRLLDSIKEFIDYWVIIDTGSTDNTVEILESFKQEVNGEIHHSTWNNFQDNRNELLEKTLDKGKYTLLMDADMILKKVNENFTKQDLINHLENNYTNPCFSIKQVNQLLNWWNNRIINRSKNVWIYSVVTHETLVVLKSEYPPEKWTDQKLDQFLWISDIGDGGSKTKKLERDIRLLTESLPKETNSYKIFHMLFYLGQSYINLAASSDLSNEYVPDDRLSFRNMAVRLYNNAIELAKTYPVDEEELWCCKWFLGVAMHAVGFSLRQVQNQYLSAFNLRPYRMEPMYDLMFLCLSNNDIHSAYHFGKMCLEPFNDQDKKFNLKLLSAKQDNLFIRRDYREVLFWFYFGLVCEHLGLSYLTFACALELKKANQISELYKLKQKELEEWIKKVSEKLLETIRLESQKQIEQQKPQEEDSKNQIINSKYQKFIPKDLIIR